MKDCIEHLYSWDYTIPDAIGCPGCKERERIIKLLKEHMPNSSDHDFVGCECEYPTNNWYNDHLVALIKGENK